MNILLIDLGVVAHFRQNSPREAQMEKIFNTFKMAVILVCICMLEIIE